MQHGGKVLGTAIDKYCYLNVRKLPPFFTHKHRIVYSKAENVLTVDEIQHPAVRTVLQHLDVDYGVSIHHDGDIPARSGMGSSSAFTAGLLKGMHALQGKYISKEDLTKESIYVEQELIRENVGSQDQTFAVYGGFNVIEFHKNGEIEVNPMPTPDFTFNEVCLGEPTVFTDASTVNPPSGVITQWEWAFGDGTYASGQNQEHTYAAAGSFQVTLTTYTSVGQCAQSITKQILVKMSAEANAGPDVSIHNGWHTDLSGSASGGSGNYAFYWQPEALVENPNNAETPTVSLNATQLLPSR